MVLPSFIHRPLLLGALIWLGARVPSALAHPGVDEQIARLTALIEKSPADAELRLQRAEQFRLHAEFTNALAEVAVAAKLKPGWPAPALTRARIFSDSARWPEALAAAESFLAATPSHPEALILRARSLARLQRATEAVADYSGALKLIPKPAPDLFLERARTQAALGRFADAVAGLDEGQARLGELVSLQLPAIEYERAQTKFAAALARVDRLLAHSSVKETWLASRGEILEQAGRLTEARETFQRALAGLAEFPAAQRGREMNSELEQRLRAGLARTERRLALASTQPTETHAR
ncbi:MAG: tetratricopeptide repeat protein [Verrucomicrobia bacterium]|nr:MAG: tetratricopeptide repeat protein [Verrucomicrobiota bacterium]